MSRLIFHLHSPFSILHSCLLSQSQILYFNSYFLVSKLFPSSTILCFHLLSFNPKPPPLPVFCSQSLFSTWYEPCFTLPSSSSTLQLFANPWWPRSIGTNTSYNHHNSYINGPYSIKSNGFIKDYLFNRVHKTCINIVTNDKIHNIHEELEGLNMIYIAPRKVVVERNPNNGTFMCNNEYPSFTAIIIESLKVSSKLVTIRIF